MVTVEKEVVKVTQVTITLTLTLEEAVSLRTVLYDNICFDGEGGAEIVEQLFDELEAL